MKRLKHLWILILLFGLVSMSACGKPEEEPVERPPSVIEITGYDLQKYNETLVAYQILLKQHAELEVLYERTKAREPEYIAAVRILEDANLELGIELGIMKGIGVGRADNYEALLNELAVLRAEKKDWGWFAEKEYEQLLVNYNKLDALFPPTHFSSDKELIKWRANTGNVTALGCLGLQRLAFTGGYIVSVHPDFDYCVAIAGDYWYRITPEDQDLVGKMRRSK